MSGRAGTDAEREKETTTVAITRSIAANGVPCVYLVVDGSSIRLDNEWNSEWAVMIVREAIAAARVKALEEAAAIADQHERAYVGDRGSAPRTIASRIRAAIATTAVPR